MDKKVVIINGTGGSGKDTFVCFTQKYAQVINYSSIDNIKEIAKIIGWNGTKTEKDRKFLSDLKKLTTEYNDFAFHKVMEAYQEFLNSTYNIMFIHVREPEEITKIKKAIKKNVYTLLIKRTGLENINSNYSDKEIDNYKYDFYIMNDNLEQLDKEALNFINKLREK